MVDLDPADLWLEDAKFIQLIQCISKHSIFNFMFKFYKLKLILCRYPPHWVPVADLYAAMGRLDPATGKPRGFLELEAMLVPSSALFTLASASRSPPVLLQLFKIFQIKTNRIKNNVSFNSKQHIVLEKWKKI